MAKEVRLERYNQQTQLERRDNSMQNLQSRRKEGTTNG
jgi:hypothetical protein